MSTLPEDPTMDPAQDSAHASAPAMAPDSAVPPSTDSTPVITPDEAIAADATTASAATPPSAADTAQTGAQLAERFPALFKGTPPKPLKLRIQTDIQERAPGVFTKAALSAFLRRHTGATSYLIAVSKGQQRFDLDGQPAGELTDEHRKVAAEELERRRAKRLARAEEDAAARRARAQLLNEHTANQLPIEEFCALKGIEPGKLDTVLAQARQEAAEAAKAGPGRDGHGPRRHGPGDRQGRPEGARRDGAGPGRRGPGGADRTARPAGEPGAPAAAGTEAAAAGAPRAERGERAPGPRTDRPNRPTNPEGARRDGAPRDGTQAGAPTGAPRGDARGGRPGEARRDGAPRGDGRGRDGRGDRDHRSDRGGPSDRGPRPEQRASSSGPAPKTAMAAALEAAKAAAKPDKSDPS